MRSVEILPGEHYHVYNRGNDRKTIFLDDRDHARFLFLILYFQTPANFQQIYRIIKTFLKKKVFEVDTSKHIFSKRYVELENFALMPNHFHLLVYQKEPAGISQYMQRTLNSYTKYFNTKYEKSGHLFQGPYKIVRVEDNEQLLHLSAYIHRNPREIRHWTKRENQYPWSSYQDYVTKNRWGNLLAQNTITDQFKDVKEYRKFVETSGTKDLDDAVTLD